MLPFGRRPERRSLQQCCVEAQGVLIDVMSDHEREIDEVDFLLRDALRISQDAAPNADRIFAALRARVVAEYRPRQTAWSQATPSWTSPYMSASYWYLAPLIRVMR